MGEELRMEEKEERRECKLGQKKEKKEEGGERWRGEERRGEERRGEERREEAPLISSMGTDPPSHS